MDNHCSGKITLVKSYKTKHLKMWICKMHNCTNIDNITGPIYAKVWLNSCIFIQCDYISDDCEKYDIHDADTIILEDEEMPFRNELIEE